MISPLKQNVSNSKTYLRATAIIQKFRHLPYTRLTLNAELDENPCASSNVIQKKKEEK